MPKLNDIPAELDQLLASAEKRVNLPAGTMRSILQQEVGGQVGRFLKDPTTYHYEADAKGQRVSPRTGKVSTAFGPFGILESTARDPGWGVQPLKDKSLAEQVRFASEYLAARSKAAGSLQAGLAGYGEGKKYAQQVSDRIGPNGPTRVAAAALPSSQGASPVATRAEAPAAAESAPTPQGFVLPPSLLAYLASRGNAPGAPAGSAPAANAWLAFLKKAGPSPTASEPVAPVNQGIDYLGVLAQAQRAVPVQTAQTFQSARPDFNRFGGFGGWGPAQT